MLLAKTSVNAHANDFWWFLSDTCWWLSSDTCRWLSSNDLHMHLQWISNTFAKTLSDDSRLMLCKRLLSDALQKTFVWWLLSMLLANAHSQMLSTNTLANAFRKWSSLFAITVLMISNAFANDFRWLFMHLANVYLFNVWHMYADWGLFPMIIDQRDYLNCIHSACCNYLHSKCTFAKTLSDDFKCTFANAFSKYLR